MSRLVRPAVMPYDVRLEPRLPVGRPSPPRYQRRGHRSVLGSPSSATCLLHFAAGPALRATLPSEPLPVRATGKGHRPVRFGDPVRPTIPNGTQALGPNSKTNDRTLVYVEARVCVHGRGPTTRDCQQGRQERAEREAELLAKQEACQRGWANGRPEAQARSTQFLSESRACRRGGPQGRSHTI
jgi:hypothetical protein